jgi:hypothetical protein
VFRLRNLPGSMFSVARSINDVGRAVGSSVIGGDSIATEWRGGKVIDLGGLLFSARVLSRRIHIQSNLI